MANLKTKPFNPTDKKPMSQRHHRMHDPREEIRQLVVHLTGYATDMVAIQDETAMTHLGGNVGTDVNIVPQGVCLLKQIWKHDIKLEFIVPATSSQAEIFNTLLSTGNNPDMMSSTMDTSAAPTIGKSLPKLKQVQFGNSDNNLPEFTGSLKQRSLYYDCD